MRLIGFSAKKQGGKDTAGNYVTGLVLKERFAIRDFKIDNNGKLNILTIYQDGTEDWGILDLKRRDEEFIYAAENTIWPYVKVYSFADRLKALAVDLFELDPKSVYGNEEERAAPTHLRWENMPGVVTPKMWSMTGGFIASGIIAYPENFYLIEHDPGPMSGREFLQFFGTEIGRKMYGPIWINATINKILSEQPEYAIITDVRFPDEVNAITKAGGETYRFTRDVLHDTHASENALNPDVFNWNLFTKIIDNSNKSIEETCGEVKCFTMSNTGPR